MAWRRGRWAVRVGVGLWVLPEAQRRQTSHPQPWNQLKEPRASLGSLGTGEPRTPTTPTRQAESHVPGQPVLSR